MVRFNSCEHRKLSLENMVSKNRLILKTRNIFAIEPVKKSL